jgi:NAD(P)-dependent dehydrogenase (short-subunit alcohol dehydrogenase family)
MDLPTDLAGSRLASEVAIVTGAGFDGEFIGTGAALAMTFAAQGAKVALIDTSGERAQKTLDRIADLGGDGFVVEADVSDAAACAAAVAAVRGRFGRLDILVNNAAIAEGGTVVDIDLQVWDRVVDVNLGGVMRMSRAAIPAMRSGGRGSIVNISSIAATRGLGTSAYAAAKAGVIGLTSDMAYSHGREGIRVNCIIPGHLHTPMGYRGDPEVRAARQSAGLLGTEGNAWDVAWAGVFFASKESRWITGTSLPVDAGTTATTAFAMRTHLRDLS